MSSSGTFVVGSGERKYTMKTWQTVAGQIVCDVGLGGNVDVVLRVVLTIPGLGLFHSLIIVCFDMQCSGEETRLTYSGLDAHAM
jgi:hypothetical protein